jgi:hypothetical protein
MDDAARGEEFTKGSSHVVLASVIAAVLVSIAIAIYVIAGQKPPVSSGAIEQVWVHPQHSETSGFDASGAPMVKESFDQVYVFALVKIHNESKQPLFLHNILTNATLSDAIHSSYAATPVDYERVFQAYPKMPVPHGKPMPNEATIDPGQTLEGTIVSTFRVTKQEWDAHKDLNFTFEFRYQPNLVLAPTPTAVIEQ